ncbi:response regulator transcription factor [Paraburkholderia pallida]|uniref:Response regulator transcription factor n=2 Tax=Paraburkholderia pallida TaxID=2547399 RepID=A0A4P7D2N2_9BURK|nr:response regulator [Paraburkholderia pallida]QBR01467.1 response regulator transcription factor [Paraburkholderia pallida]
MTAESRVFRVGRTTLESAVIDHANTVIHVVDDDSAMRVALRRLLHGAGYEVRDYASAGEYLVSEPDTRSGCLLLDLELGGPSGLELQQALRRHPRALPVVFMSAYSDVPRTVQAMKAGAVDFLLKPFDRHALFDALDAALSSPATAEPAGDDGPPVDLGDREKAVLRGIVAGLRNKQIAAQLGLSERTIKSCRAGLMHKFEATSLAELLRRAESMVSVPMMQ